MKLAEALVVRADLKTRAEQLRDRIKQSSLVQEGEQPAEDPANLLVQLDEVLTRLTNLIISINHTNLQSVLPQSPSFPHSITLTEALAQRDVLDLHRSILKTIADTASERLERYSLREIRRVATVDVGALRRQIDDLARRRRELDTAIQAVNWTTELIE